MPDGAAQNYTLVDPFQDQDLQVTHLTAGEKTTFKLKPFEVLVMEAQPADKTTNLSAK